MNTKNVLVTESSLRGDRMWDIYSRLLKDRVVYVGGPIDDETANAIVGQLLFLEKEDNTAPISMYINSPGGYVTSGLAIYDTMNYVSCPVNTICVGQAMSMGAVLLSSGKKGGRVALENASIMIHQPLGGAYGQASDIIIQAEQTKRVKDKINQILSSNCSKPISDVEKDTDRDYFLTPQQALEYGLIDKIIDRKVK